jgi:hypothetical protein
MVQSGDASRDVIRALGPTDGRPRSQVIEQVRSTVVARTASYSCALATTGEKSIRSYRQACPRK